MRVSTLLPFALAFGPAAVSAKSGLLGFALGTKRPDGTCKDTPDYVADFAVLEHKSHIVRGYDASDCKFAEKILPAAQQASKTFKRTFKVILGIWPDTDDSFTAGKNAVQTFAPQFKDNVAAITVGSETLYRRNFTGSELAEKITQVRKLVPGFKIGTADVWNNYTDGSADAAVKASDILLANAFPYWQGQDIKNASHSFFDSIGRAVSHIQQVAGGKDAKEIWVGETGWPTGGTSYQAAEPSIQNAQTFWKQGICGMLRMGVNVFAFEAFDEPWKPVSKGENGESKDETHWGVFDAKHSKTAKYNIAC